MSDVAVAGMRAASLFPGPAIWFAGGLQLGLHVYVIVCTERQANRAAASI